MFRQGAMTSFILPAAARDQSLFSGLAIVAYAHLDAMYERPIQLKALEIKARATHSINQYLCNPDSALTIPNIGAVCALASAVNVCTPFISHFVISKGCAVE
jgi:hypothetical protein